jgi:hypothetical protein
MQHNRIRMPWRAIGMLTVALLGSGALAAWAQRNPSGRPISARRTCIRVGR